MPRTTREILDHTDELAKRFEDYGPKPEDRRNPQLLATMHLPGDRHGAQPLPGKHLPAMTAHPLSPIHPGKFLLANFLEPAGVSPDRLAHQIGLTPRRIEEIIDGTHAIDAGSRATTVQSVR
ncbi:hypothetical protein [Rhodococcus sp. ARC_M6]|uniref:helix-turn-helix transcriptional regulator n=1 Tax=Rhodococcus sp. ARC_M6 TaxID=2928852 RepID=UPI001FB39B3F|nr:hypothetical protein [Rhodococcus sp. ARC_M6]MCJ0907072.1 hypothetical protein [Rhodococcus sp. ARC_M6]